MPEPITTSLILGGAALMGGGANAYAQGKMNKKNRQHQVWMYDKQRQDALSDWERQNQYNEQMWGRINEYNEGLWNKQNKYNEDLWNRQNQYNENRWNIQNQYDQEMWHKQNAYNEQMWNKQNEYNSPAAQMQRFKDAGLNPNLIYGSGNTSGSISTASMQSHGQGAASQGSASQRSAGQSSASVRGASGGAYQGRAPQLDLRNGLMAYADIRQRTAQTNNLEKQNDVLTQDAALRAAQTANTVSQTAKTKFELGLASELRQTSLDAAKEGLRKLTIEADLALNRDEREAASNASGLAEAAQRISNMRSQKVSTDLDTRLKVMDIQLRKLGVQPNDPLYMRILGRILNTDGVNNLLKP